MEEKDVFDQETVPEPARFFCGGCGERSARLYVIDVGACYAAFVCSEPCEVAMRLRLD